jgi:hypothetical protein
VSNIKYICLSDLHLGQNNSLLTRLQNDSQDINPLQPSEVLKKLYICLKELITKNNHPDVKPTLILNGDILEFALCNVNESSMVFETFLRVFMRENEELFSNIIYIPGNHDHHIWEIARETQYVNYLINQVNPGDTMNPPWHATNIFKNEDDKLVGYFLTKLIQRHKHLQNFEIKIAYPNFGLINEEMSKCIIFHHGHYTEKICNLMSHIMDMIFYDRKNRKEPLEIWQIENENFAWIDFFWSTMGRSGDVGCKVETIYESLQHKKATRKIIFNFSKSLAAKVSRFKLTYWINTFIIALLIFVGVSLVPRNISRLEKRKTEEVLSKASKLAMKRYIEGPLLKQLKKELNDEIPPEITFVFGHTHKPMEIKESYSGYPSAVKICNTGGWVIEKPQYQEINGASVLVIDEELHSTSIRLYNEHNNIDEYKVYVSHAFENQIDANHIYFSVQRIINENTHIWNDFSQEVAKDVKLRAEQIGQRLKELDWCDLF